MKNVEEFMKQHHNLKITSNSNNCDITSKYEQLQELDKIKTKVLKYILYKKRTEKEVRQKFSSMYDENTLEDVIQNLKDNGYINDEIYIERAVNEFMAINTLSTKEIRNKLYTKGVNSNLIDDYFSKHEGELEEYEIACAKKIMIKKQSQLENKEIEIFLYKKGYKSENVKQAFEELL